MCGAFVDMWVAFVIMRCVLSLCGVLLSLCDVLYIVILQELQQHRQHDWQSVIYGFDIFPKAVEIVQRNRITGDLNRRPMRL